MRICEVCGREIIGPAYLALIEGAELVVCAECTQYAKWFRKLGRGRPARRTPQASAQRAPRTSTFRTQRVMRAEQAEALELVEDFGRRVKEAREAKGLTQEELGKLIGEKASVISRIESGRMAPDVALARKLEHALGIRLLTRAGEEVKVRVAKPPPVPALTLGDILAMSEAARGKKGHEEAEGRPG